MKKEEIVRHALAAGFDECRVAPATRATHAELFAEWLEEEKNGSMAWLEKDPERRMDPRVVLPGAKSVVVVGLNYWQEDPPGNGRSGAPGKFARYAWGDDYHEVIEKKMKVLVRRLRDEGGDHRFYVDYGPVLERDFASEAGLGWNGKSTMQIHPKLGTWFFLAEILTTLELEPDEPMNDHCGKCKACIDACPTDAITEVRRLDARRCISYLTIESDGPIPEEFREAVGDRVFGCDECLDVCPWNRFALASRETRFAMRPFVNEMVLRDFLALDDAEFRELFRKSPVKRTGRARFLRNVCVALGNVGSEEDLPALRNAEEHEEELIAEHARWAIGRIEG